MVLIRKYELQRMSAKRERNFSFSLTGAKVQMIEIIWYRFIERREIGIDQQVMMSGVEFFKARGRDAHSNQSKTDDWCGNDIRVLRGINEVHFRSRRRGVTASYSGMLHGSRRCSSGVNDMNMYAIGKQRYRVWNMALIAQ